ncbi:hypothetical protein [Paracoccus jeotgali]|uniref:hypothetical protein n=1 Tax=Paracoccus jeotgali TaxID=2065379 RepID=UPI0028A9A72F|nr:hypothetical protein [Paracoccus jeotgali]
MTPSLNAALCPDGNTGSVRHLSIFQELDPPRFEGRDDAIDSFCCNEPRVIRLSLDPSQGDERHTSICAKLGLRYSQQPTRRLDSSLHLVPPKILH